MAFALQYLTLASLMWMGVEAVNLYQKLVRIFEGPVRHFVLKATVIAWGEFYLKRREVKERDIGNMLIGGLQTCQICSEVTFK